MRQEALVSQFEVQLAIDFSNLKAGELTPDECADLMQNHHVDYLDKARRLPRLHRWQARRAMGRLLGHKLAVLTLYDGQPLPSLDAIKKQLRRIGGM